MFPIRDSVPSRRTPVVTWTIILANVFVFVFFELPLAPRELRAAFYTWGLVPARYFDPDWIERLRDPPGYLPFFTSMFLHGGWLHLIGNMWILAIFGDNVEDRMGKARYLAFYVVSGLFAGALHAWTSPASPIPTVGASGAIAGVMGAYFMLFPRARVVAVVPIFFYPFFFTLPAVTYLLFWFLMQLWSGALALAGPAHVGGVAWWAHVGGFAAGALFYGFFLERPRRPAAAAWP